jgi:hypothetical protein
MFKHSLFVAAALLSTLASAAAPEWIQIANTEPGSAFLDRATIAPAGEAMAVRVMRNYDDTVTLGINPATGRTLYSHRSVKLTYLVDCKGGKLAMNTWQLFSGNFGEGQVVWADKQPGAPIYLKPAGGEEKFAFASACAMQAALAMR